MYRRRETDDDSEEVPSLSNIPETDRILLQIAYDQTTYVKLTQARELVAFVHFRNSYITVTVDDLRNVRLAILAVRLACGWVRGERFNALMV